MKQPTSGRWTCCIAPAWSWRASSLVIDHAHHSVGRVHPLRAQQRVVLAGADGDPADDRAVVRLGGGLLSRVPAHRRRHPAGDADGPRGKAVLGWIIEALHARHQPVHALVRHQARASRPGTRASRSFRSSRSGVSYLPMPIGGARHGAVRHRAPADAEHSSRSPRPRPHARSRPSSGRRPHGRPDPGRRLHRALPARHAGRLRARPCGDPRGAVDRPSARGGHAQDLRRHGRLSAARDPVLHPVRRHHGRRRHGRAHRQSRQGVRRLHPRRAGAGQHPRIDHVRLHLGLVGRRHRLDRLGDDPADDQERLSAAVRRQRHDLGLAAAAADPALAQRGDLFARRRRHRVGRAPVHGRRDSGRCCSGSR